MRRVLMILWFAFLWATAMYWVVIEMIPTEPTEAGSSLRVILLMVAGTNAAAVLFLRLGRIGAMLSRATPIAPEELVRLRTWYILCFAISEAVALYGLVLHFMGGNRADVAMFFLGGVVLLLVCYPKVPEG